MQGQQVLAGNMKRFYFKSFEKVEQLLKKESDIKVLMTRSDDTFISQESRQRPKYANEVKADLFISIHGNTFSDSSVSGTETFYYHKNSQSFSEIMQKHVVEATGFRDRGAMKRIYLLLRKRKCRLRYSK